MRLAMMSAVVGTLVWLAGGFARIAHACCGNEADQVRLKRVFSVPGTDAASVYVLMSSPEEAIAELEAAMKISKKCTRYRMRQDRDYDVIRDSETFKALLAD